MIVIKVDITTPFGVINAEIDTMVVPILGEEHETPRGEVTRTGDHTFMMTIFGSRDHPLFEFVLAHEFAHIELGHLYVAHQYFDRPDYRFVDHIETELQTDLRAIELLSRPPDADVLYSAIRRHMSALVMNYLESEYDPNCLPKRLVVWCDDTTRSFYDHTLRTYTPPTYPVGQGEDSLSEGLIPRLTGYAGWCDTELPF